jgi:Uma2 family endonuclease
MPEATISQVRLLRVIIRVMGTMLESPPRPLSISEVAAISRQLADDISRLVLRTEGFSVDDYLSLGGRYFVEYLDGRLQVLPMPTAFHQAIAFVLANLLVEWSSNDPLARTKLGPFRVRLNDTDYREPDVCFMRGANAAKRHDQFWEGADLVVEVISESNQDHDYRTKYAEYASAGIPEYWIIDPEQRVISVFTLSDFRFDLHGQFRHGQVVSSIVLDGFAVDVAKLFTDAELQA